MDSLIQTLTERHPESVAQLFKAYGYEMPVTSRNLQNFIKVHGNKPLPFSNASGEEKPKEGKTLLEVLTGLADSTVNVLNAIKQPKKVSVTPETYEDPATPRIFGINKTIFAMLAGLAALVLAVMIFRKK